VRDHRDGSGKARPIVRDHRDTSEEAQVVCIKAPCPGSSDSSAKEGDRIEDPGIRQCDITPVECEDTNESRDSVVVRDHRDGGGSKDEEAASAPGGVKVGVNNPSATAPKEAVSAPADEAEQAANRAPSGSHTPIGPGEWRTFPKASCGS
jgi:hypothetical protein